MVDELQMAVRETTSPVTTSSVEIIKREIVIIRYLHELRFIHGEVFLVPVVEAVNIVGLAFVAVTVGVRAGLEVGAAAAADHAVPVHHQAFAVLLLADAAEES